jgi:hypothetical protein
MIVFAIIVVIIIAAIACVEIVCSQFNANDLHNMGIRR